MVDRARSKFLKGTDCLSVSTTVLENGINGSDSQAPKPAGVHKIQKTNLVLTIPGRDAIMQSVRSNNQCNDITSDQMLWPVTIK
jgi:hypothetical protein